MSPLTPAEALAIAAILTHHPKRQPHWDAWIDKLRTWGNTNTETPCQDTEMGTDCGTLRGVNEAVPESAETLIEDLTASPQLSEQEA